MAQKLAERRACFERERTAEHEQSDRGRRDGARGRECRGRHGCSTPVCVHTAKLRIEKYVLYIRVSECAYTGPDRMSGTKAALLRNLKAFHGRVPYANSSSISPPGRISIRVLARIAKVAGAAAAAAADSPYTAAARYLSHSRAHTPFYIPVAAAAAVGFFFSISPPPFFVYFFDFSPRSRAYHS